MAFSRSDSPGAAGSSQEKTYSEDILCLQILPAPHRTHALFVPRRATVSRPHPPGVYPSARHAADMCTTSHARKHDMPANKFYTEAIQIDSELKGCTQTPNSRAARTHARYARGARTHAGRFCVAYQELINNLRDYQRSARSIYTHPMCSATCIQTRAHTRTHLRVCTSTATARPDSLKHPAPSRPGCFVPPRPRRGPTVRRPERSAPPAAHAHPAPSTAPPAALLHPRHCSTRGTAPPAAALHPR